MSPERDEVSDGESTGGSIPYEPTNKKTKNADDDEDSGSDEEEGVYIVEKIVGHEFKKNGTLLLNVKWKGYDDPSDQTLEPLDSLLEGAEEAVKEYFESIGGQPQPPGKQAPGRKRKSVGETKSTATPEPKKQRKSRGTTNGTDASSSKKGDPYSFPDEDNDLGFDPTSWTESDVMEVETIMPDPSGHNLLALVKFKYGQSRKISLELCYEKMPMKMLKFYEAHLTFKPENSND